MRKAAASLEHEIKLMEGGRTPTLRIEDKAADYTFECPLPDPQELREALSIITTTNDKSRLLTVTEILQNYAKKIETSEKIHAVCDQG